MTRTSLATFLTIALFGGCSQAPPAPYPDWGSPSRRYSPSITGGQGFDAYCQAAAQAVRAAPEESRQVSFPKTPPKGLLARLKPALDTVRAGAKRAFEYRYSIQDPFETSEHARGWRLIGRGLVWQIEEGARSGEKGRSVEALLVATRFGFDLAQGDAQTATLGLTIVNEARAALAPYLKQMSVGQLTALYSGLSRIVTKFPGLRATLDNEEERVMLGVQFVQECRKKNEYERLEMSLGKSAGQAVSFLKGLAEEKRPAYFQSFAGGARSYMAHWKAEVEKPAIERTEWVESESTRPWRKFREAFAGSVPPLVGVFDKSLAHTRLLAITSWAQARVSSSRQAPSSLQHVPLGVCEDPYSGKRLVFRSAGPEFKVYSVGQDGIDDGGESNETGDSPDVVLQVEGL